MYNTGPVNFDLKLLFDPFIGLVCRPLTPRPEREYERFTSQILNRLSPVDGHHFDLVVLNALPSILAFRIIKSGHLIYQNDPYTVTDFINKVRTPCGCYENGMFSQEDFEIIVTR